MKTTIEKVILALIIVLCVIWFRACSDINEIMNKHTHAEDLCIVKYGTAEYKLVDKTVYCMVNGKYEVAEHE